MPGGYGMSQFQRSWSAGRASGEDWMELPHGEGYGGMTLPQQKEIEIEGEMTSSGVNAVGSRECARGFNLR